MSDIVVLGPVGGAEEGTLIAAEKIDIARDISPVVKQQLAFVLPSGDTLVDRFYNSCAVAGGLLMTSTRPRSEHG